MGEMNLSHIHYSIPPTAANCTFFSAAHETFSRRDHILGHKENLNKSKKRKRKRKTIPYILTDHNEIIWQGKPPKPLTLMEIEQHTFE
jgi:hypothetical protein